MVSTSPAWTRSPGHHPRCRCVRPAHPHATGGHRCSVYPTSSLSDVEWALLEPLPPAPGNTGGRRARLEKWCRRLACDAIFYLVRGGIAWRQRPVEFPRLPRCMRSLPGGRAPGCGSASTTRCATVSGCASGAIPCPPAAVINPQTVPGADTMPGSSGGWDGGKRWSQTHLAVDVTRLVLAVLVTAANIQDRDAAPGCWPARAPAPHHRAGLGRWGLSREAGPVGHVLALPVQIIKRPRGLGFQVRPWVWVIERTTGWQIPALGARLRNPPRSPRGHGLPSHDRHHDPATSTRLASSRTLSKIK